MALSSVTPISPSIVMCWGRKREVHRQGEQRCRIVTRHTYRELEEDKLLCPSTTVHSQILMCRQDLLQYIQCILPKGKDSKQRQTGIKNFCLSKSIKRLKEY